MGSNVVGFPGQMGRPPLPTATKELAGTARKDRANPHEPRPAPIAIPPAPEGLAGYEAEARVILKAQVDLLHTMSGSDLFVFDLAVLSAAVVLAARAAWRAAGWAVTYELKSKSGSVTILPRPEMGIIATHSKILVALLAQMGMTPAARGRVMALLDPEPPTTDKLAKYRV